VAIFLYKIQMGLVTSLPTTELTALRTRKRARFISTVTRRFLSDLGVFLPVETQINYLLT